MPSLCLGCNISRQYIWTTQGVTPLMRKDLSWSLNISCRISSPGSKTRNWSCLNSVSCGVSWWIFHISIHEGRHNTTKLGISCATHLTKWCTREYWTQGYLVNYRSWGISHPNSNSCAKSHTKKSGKQGSVSLWINKNSSFRGSSKHIKFTKSLLCLKIIQRAQWDTISWGIKMVKNP